MTGDKSLFKSLKEKDDGYVTFQGVVVTHKSLEKELLTFQDFLC